MGNDARKLDKAGQRRLRCEVIDRWRRHLPKKTIAEQLVVSRPFIDKCIRRYEQDGNDGLKEDNRGRPTYNSLSISEEKQLITDLVSKRPENIDGLNYYLWTREAIIQYCKNKYKSSLSNSEAYRLTQSFVLGDRICEKNCNVSIQKIRRMARKENAVILWAGQKRWSYELRRDYMGYYTIVSDTIVFYVSDSYNRFAFGFYCTRNANKAFIRFLRLLFKQYHRKVLFCVKASSLFFVENEHYDLLPEYDKIDSYNTEMLADEYVSNWLDSHKQFIEVYEILLSPL